MSGRRAGKAALSGAASLPARNSSFIVARTPHVRGHAPSSAPRRRGAVGDGSHGRGPCVVRSGHSYCLYSTTTGTGWQTNFSFQTPPKNTTLYSIKSPPAAARGGETVRTLREALATGAAHTPHRPGAGGRTHIHAADVRNDDSASGSAQRATARPVTGGTTAASWSVSGVYVRVSGLEEGTSRRLCCGAGESARV